MNKKPGIEDIYPLTPAQQGMLFHTLDDPEAGFYINQVDCPISGDLDARAFEAAWQQVVRRHPSLRAAIVWQTRSEPMQVIRSDAQVSLVQEDWTHLPPAQQEARYRELLAEDRREGFELSKAPLMRLRLFRLAAREWRFLWTHHHILLDGWSLGIVIRELFAMYDAAREGRSAELPDHRPFREYLDWLKRQDRAAAERYWREALAGFEAPTPLGVDRLASAAPQGAGFAEHAFRLPASLTAALKGLQARTGLTLNAVLQGAWALLLSRYSGQERVLFGAAVAGRPASLPGVEEMVGCFINLLPVPVSADPGQSVLAFLRELQQRFLDSRDYEHSPLLDVQRWSAIPTGTPLFESLVIFENTPVSGMSGGHASLRIEGKGLERTHYPLTLFIEPGEHELVLQLCYDGRRFEPTVIERMAGHLQTLLEGFAASPERRLFELSLLPAAERHQLLREWNATDVELPSPQTLHSLVERQADATPEARACVFEDRALTYRELDARSNQLASRLRDLGVGAGTVVGVCVERSLEMVVALLGILKAGSAYLPLDPTYPAKRLAFMVADSHTPVIVTQPHLEDLVRGCCQGAPVRLLSLATGGESLAGESAERPGLAVDPLAPAYVIYTSGSTGSPKGVVVSHRNVANFLTGMDARLGMEPPRVWLSVTSISFDIAALELWWTLSRGFTVVVQGGEPGTMGLAERRPAGPRRELAFSLYYFASEEEADAREKYRLLLEGARFADAHGFQAVWTPERHFHRFGGLFPNPAVLGAALATITQRIHIRAGSVVAPLHHPVRIAEEWSVVDNLSGGRVGVSLASGWHPNDFVFAPERHAERRRWLREGLDVVRRLWRGEPVSLPGGEGTPVEVRLHPRPVQRELPLWLTSSGSPETFRLAGEQGLNLLTHLLGQRIEDLAANIQVYRDAWRRAGHLGEGQVTVMVHTFVGNSLEAVKQQVKAPFIRYLRGSVDLLRQWVESAGETVVEDERELELRLSRAFDRYFHSSALFGTPDTCQEMVERLRGAGVDEVACLIDFGVETDAVLASLPFLDTLRERSTRTEDYSLPAQLKRHGVGYLQCTPSLARALVEDEEALAALRPLRRWMVGGEALPMPLAERLREAISGDVINMYGPTETTIWSSTRRIDRELKAVTLGTPIANTGLYILDAHGEPVPMGVAGELYIGGEGVAHGYLRRPELTAERFVPDPFSGRPGARLYRTGDQARWLPGGEVEFLGRVDHQVKIRGHRVELGEIESVLGRHAGVREAVVVAREDTPGALRLVAYYVPRLPAPGPAELRDHLRRELPDSMLPAAFVALEALPLTPNRKVDRKALPPPEEAPPMSGADFTPPRDDTERLLADIWAEVLRTPRVGIHDDFFTLGGDSILTIQIAARARKAGLDVAPGTVFRHPTVARLAEALRGVTAPAAAQEAQAPASLPLLPAQAALLPRAAATPPVPEQMWLDTAPGLEPALLRRALDWLVSQHDALRLRFRPAEGGGWVQALEVGEARVPLFEVDLSAAPEADWRAQAEVRVAQVLAGASLEAPALRAVLLGRGRGLGGALLLAAHPLVVDGPSWSRLAEDLARAYEALRRGELLAPATRPPPFQAVAEAVLRLAHAAEVGASLDYWTHQLAGGGHRLPVDVERPPAEAGGWRLVEAALAPERTQSLLDALPSVFHAELPEVLLAALGRTLAGWCGAGTLLVEVEGGGRDPELLPGADLSRTVGRLSSHFPVRLPLASGVGRVEGLKQAKQLLREPPQRGLGFGLLRFLGSPEQRQRLEQGAAAELRFSHAALFRPLHLDAGAHLRPVGLPTSSAGSSSLKLRVEARLFGGRLQTLWAYREHLYRPATVEALARAMLEEVEGALAELKQSGSRAFVPSDFPEAGLSPEQLERLLRSVGK